VTKLLLAESIEIGTSAIAKLVCMTRTLDRDSEVRDFDAIVLTFGVEHILE